MQNDLYPIKPYSLKELSAMYERSEKTILRWLQKVKGLGERVGHSYNVKQILLIFNHCGTPVKENGKK